MSFKICNGSTLFEFTCTTRALNCENTNEESPGDTSINKLCASSSPSAWQQLPGRKVCLKNNQINRAFIPFLHQNNTLIYKTLSKPSWKNCQNIFLSKSEAASICSRSKISRHTIKIVTLSRKFKMPFWPEPLSDQCHFPSLRWSTLCYALVNYIVPLTNHVPIAEATITLLT